MKRILILLSLILFINLVLSAPPTTTLTDYQRGIDIVHPETQVVSYGKDLEFNFWTYNTSDGRTITNASTNCTLYIINNQGVNYFRFSNQPGGTGLMAYGKGSPLCVNCWTMTLPKENITLGPYSYQIKCQGQGIGGYTTGFFEVTPTGSIITDGESLVFIFSYLPLIMLFGFFMIVFYSVNYPPFKLMSMLFMIVILITVILSTLVNSYDVLYYYTNLTDGLSSVWFVLQIALTTGLLVLILYSLYLGFTFWAYKRGRGKEDDD
jgi:hypothetical protein